MPYNKMLFNSRSVFFTTNSIEIDGYYQVKSNCQLLHSVKPSMGHLRREEECGGGEGALVK